MVKIMVIQLHYIRLTNQVAVQLRVLGEWKFLFDCKVRIKYEKL